MPRVEFTFWDRAYALKVICTLQMTFSSFVSLLYIYISVLQYWLSFEDPRTDVWKYKWIILVISLTDTSLGTLLAFAANMKGIRCRRRIVVWIILEIFLIPIAIFFLMRLYYKLTRSAKKIPTDPHYARINLAQVFMYVLHFFYVAFAIDFIAYKKRSPKVYDPNIRPHSVYAPTDPQITTTESRHIRLSQSLLFQPSTSKGSAYSNLRIEDDSDKDIKKVNKSETSEEQVKNEKEEKN